MEVEQTIHPQPQPDTHHRKIELQSLQDLTYLQSNLIASARQQLDLHFPLSAAQQQFKRPQPATVISLDGLRPISQQQQPAPPIAEAAEQQQEDPMRASVRSFVDAYLERIYGTAYPSITVNGLGATTLPPSTLSTLHPAPIPLTDAEAALTGPKEEKEGVDFNYEAHDTRLQKKVADMYAELESLTVQVGQLRRTAPAQGARNIGQLLSESMELEDAEHEEEVTALNEKTASKQDRKGPLDLKELPEEWFADRRALYERGTNDLAALAGLAGLGEEGGASAAERGPSLTETVGKVQRARTVAMEFE